METQEKIAKVMFQLVLFVDDKEIEQRWKCLHPSVRRQWYDKAESLIEVFKELGYRKLQGEPPLIRIPNASEFIEEDAGAYVQGYGDGATAQRKSDIEFYGGEL